jgi:hypothetical protein
MDRFLETGYNYNQRFVSSSICTGGFLHYTNDRNAGIDNTTKFQQLLFYMISSPCLLRCGAEGCYMLPQHASSEFLISVLTSPLDNLIICCERGGAGGFLALQIHMTVIAVLVVHW